MSCTAASDYIQIPPYFYSESSYKVPEKSLINFIQFSPNITDFEIWQPMLDALPNFTRNTLPDTLKPLREIPMTQLIDKLHSDPIDLPSDPLDIEFYIIIVLLVLLIPLALFLLIAYKKQILWFAVANESIGEPRQLTRTLPTAPPRNVEFSHTLSRPSIKFEALASTDVHEVQKIQGLQAKPIPAPRISAPILSELYQRSPANGIGTPLYPPVSLASMHNDVPPL